MGTVFFLFAKRVLVDGRVFRLMCYNGKNDERRMNDIYPSLRGKFMAEVSHNIKVHHEC